MMKVCGSFNALCLLFGLFSFSFISISTTLPGVIMKTIIKPLAWLAIALLSIGLSACAKSTGPQSPPPSQITVQVQAHTQPAAVVLDVYKSPSCGCCGAWVEHLEANNFAANIHHPDDLAGVKVRYGIEPRYQSCHTAISADNYVFEGHIPAAVIERFLAEKPAGAIGLAVPGMPVGSPGMEMGDRHDDYQVLLLKADGSSEVYQQITGH
jgi:hypothetical protein